MTGIGEMREEITNIIILYFYFVISIVDKTAPWCAPWTSGTVTLAIDKTQFQVPMFTHRFKAIIRQQTYCQYSIPRVLTKGCPLYNVFSLDLKGVFIVVCTHSLPDKGTSVCTSRSTSSLASSVTAFQDHYPSELTMDVSPGLSYKPYSRCAYL